MGADIPTRATPWERGAEKTQSEESRRLGESFYVYGFSLRMGDGEEKKPRITKWMRGCIT
jgi:hypothetical protein